MKIQKTDINFEGTRLKYQKLDHIIRNTNNKYPRISPYRIATRFSKTNLSLKHLEWLKYIEDKVDSNREKVGRCNFIDVIKNDLENVKKSKLGDCGESTAITLASLIANGYENFKVGLLLFDIEIRNKKNKEVIAKRFYNTTHECVIINASTPNISHDNKKQNKDAIILDSWIGFCGNIQQAFDKFHETFMGGTRKALDSRGYEYSYKPQIELLDLKIETNKNLTNDFSKQYPELVIKSNK